MYTYARPAKVAQGLHHYGHQIRQGDLVQLAEVVRHLPVVESYGNLLLDHVDFLHNPDIAVEHVLVVIVLPLDHLVPHLGPPPEAYDGRLARPGRVQDLLELEAQFPHAERATDGVEAERLGDSLPHDP